MNILRYDAIVFDLDGTPLDTLGDLAASVNRMAEKYIFQPRTEAEVRGFVGNGIRNLLRLAVPQGEQHPEFECIVSDFKADYTAHCMDMTAPYPGIHELLRRLRCKGCKVAVVSNKSDPAVKKLCAHFFDGLVNVAVGESDRCCRKPAPDMVLCALDELGVNRDRAVYVGDSDVDILTAQNSVMDCISVCWGFRNREFLIENGADDANIAENADELFALLTIA